MFITLFSLSLLFALIQAVHAQCEFSIDTPNAVQCQPTQISWNDACSQGSFDLLVVSASDMCGDAIEDLGNQNSTSLTWTVNLAAGTQFVLFIQDKSGNVAWSGNITVGPSNDTSCLSGTSSSATSSSGTPTHVSSSGAPSASPSTGGAANAGSTPSGALSTRPLSIVTLLASSALVVIMFAL